MKHFLYSHPESRKRNASPRAADASWQPIGWVIRRLVRRHHLPVATAIITADAAGLHVGDDR